MPPAARRILVCRPVRESGALEQSGDQLIRFVLRERLEGDRRRVQLAAGPGRPAIEEFRTRHAEEKDGSAAREIGDVLDQLEEGLLAPLDVVEDAEQRFLCGFRFEELPESPRDLVGCRRPVSLSQHGLERLPGGGLDEGVRVRDLLDDLDDRPVGDPVAVGETPAAHDRRPVDRRQELRDQPRLPDAGRAQDGEEIAGAFAGDVVEGVAEELQLAVSADHGDVSPADERRRLRVQREQTVCGHGLRFPFRVKRRDSLDRDGISNEPDRVRADEDLPGLGSLLQARGDVDRVSRREAFLGAGHDLARVHPDAHGETRRVVALELGVQRLECLTQLRRRAHRAQGVVLVHLRDAEHGHDGVADELLDDSSVAFDDLARELEVAREHPAETFRVEALPERRRSGHIREDNGDDLALLGRGSRCGQRRAAFAAELRVCRVFVTAARTDHHGQRLERRRGEHNGRLCGAPKGRPVRDALPADR